MLLSRLRYRLAGVLPGPAIACLHIHRRPIGLDVVIFLRVLCLHKPQFTLKKRYRISSAVIGSSRKNPPVTLLFEQDSDQRLKQMTRKLVDSTVSQLILPLLFSVVVFYSIWAVTFTAPSVKPTLFPFYKAFISLYFWRNVMGTAKPR
jgi:hypothetical protein